MGDKEILVITSKVKSYIKSKGGLKTSAPAIDALSDKVREICDRAIENAKKDKRRTLKDRDIEQHWRHPGVRSVAVCWERISPIGWENVILYGEYAQYPYLAFTPNWDQHRRLHSTLNSFLNTIVVDTIGMLLCVVVHAADIQDRDGAKLVFEKMKGSFFQITTDMVVRKPERATSM